METEELRAEVHMLRGDVRVLEDRLNCLMVQPVPPGSALHFDVAWKALKIADRELTDAIARIDLLGILPSAAA